MAVILNFKMAPLKLYFVANSTRDKNARSMSLNMLLNSQNEFFNIKGENLRHDYSLIQTKCQGGNKYALPITVKFEKSTRKFGRISLHACSS